MSNTTRRRRRPKKGVEVKSMLFNEDNYKLFILGIALVIIGFAAIYFEHKVFGFITLYIAPVIIVAGYAEVIYAIMKRPKEADKQPQS